MDKVSTLVFASSCRFEPTDRGVVGAKSPTLRSVCRTFLVFKRIGVGQMIDNGDGGNKIAVRVLYTGMLVRNHRATNGSFFRWNRIECTGQNKLCMYTRACIDCARLGAVYKLRCSGIWM